MPVFEENGFITTIDFEILRQALLFQRSCKAEGRPLIPVSVNFSRRHQEHAGDIEKISTMMKEYGIPANAIEVEITESMFMYDLKPLIQSVLQLKQNGLKVSIDDFGSGYSSLNVLAGIEADTIKLDQKFLLDVEAKKGKFSKDFLYLLIHMIRQLGFKVIAEGVETAEQVVFLTEAGCDYAQGYYYAKPMPPEEFVRFMDEHGIDPQETE